ncbi:MBL fold metallo-hydrolase [Natranaeroarchaeum aerophilus]|uniref:MBL fold metallo-hydrolase n=1 Tax=Natranaeroarchaeum aerophilus TaxID=2917711 RepID=A0AAE3FPL2_9EURY|nr:rhodanese-like domain-containing protein [Natranaeroarchaeum aerophilus]MCL9813322.1 MBL fold metallo-hydrolase [Natranaeroarchaeum aerophilus]
MAASLTAEEFRDLQDRGESYALVDTRPAESFESWHIEGAINYTYKPHHEFDVEDFRAETGLEPADRILTICAKGKSSFDIVDELAAAGYDDVTVIEDGMRAWSRVYDVTTVPTESDGIELLQVQRRAKGCLGYIVGCTETGRAAVIDATRHVEEFIEAAGSAGYEIATVFDTHVHADHISGGRKLADQLDLPYYLGEDATDRGVAYEYEPLARNEVVTVGEVAVKALATPGHTSEMVSYLLDGEAVATGDTLFVDSVGRTELQFGDAEAAEGADQLYDSLHGTLLALPEGVTVLPGHFAVSDAGETGELTRGEPIVDSVGTIRTTVDLLGRPRDAFVQHVTEHRPEKPPNYERIIGLNTGRKAVDDETEAIELELGPNRCAAE